MGDGGEEERRTPSGHLPSPSLTRVVGTALGSNSAPGRRSLSRLLVGSRGDGADVVEGHGSLVFREPVADPIIASWLLVGEQDGRPRASRNRDEGLFATHHEHYVV